MVTTKTQCMPRILDEIPEFGPQWKEHVKYWNSDEAGLCNDMAAFGRFVIEKISENNREFLERIFVLAEDLLKSGDEEVSTAVATCFLENLINAVSSDAVSSDFISFLGENSKEYCREWDKFTGVRTPGLWS